MVTVPRYSFIWTSGIHEGFNHVGGLFFPIGKGLQLVPLPSRGRPKWTCGPPGTVWRDGTLSKDICVVRIIGWDCILF